MTVSSLNETDIASLSAKAESLRASIARAHLELKNARAQERAISECLANLAQEADAPPASHRAKKVVDESTVITSRTLDAWRRRALAVAIGAAAVTALSVVAFTQLVPSRPPPPPRTTLVTPPAVATVAPAVAPAAVTAPAETAAPATVASAETRRPAAPPARTSRTPLPPNPYGGRTTRGGSLPAPPPTSDDILGRALDGEASREADEDSSPYGGPPAAHPGALGSLTVVCLPVKCDQIRVDGVALGPGHIFSRPIAAGTHTLIAHAPNGVERRLTIEVRPDQLRDVRLATFGEVAPSRD